jgi:hypothetical protein
VLCGLSDSVIEEEAAEAATWSLESGPARREVVAVRVSQRETHSIPSTRMKPTIFFDPALGGPTSRSLFTFIGSDISGPAKNQLSLDCELLTGNCFFRSSGVQELQEFRSYRISGTIRFRRERIATKQIWLSRLFFPTWIDPNS